MADETAAGGTAPDLEPHAPLPSPPPGPVTAAELRSTAALFGLFVATILLATLFARPFLSAGLRAFPDPNDVNNSLWYIALILVFTFVILYIAKRGQKWLVRAIILGAVALTIAYVLYFLGASSARLPHRDVGGLDGVSLVLALAVAAAATYALYRHPEWYVIDSVGLLVAAASAAIFGISFGLLPVIVLLALLAVYDAIAVYRTKHMLALADSVIELRLPVLLVVPKHGGYRFQEEAGKFKQANASNKSEREAMFMGLGDLVMPTMLVISALTFLAALPMAATLSSDPNLPHLDAAAGVGIPLHVHYTVVAPGAAAGAPWSVAFADGATYNGTMPGAFDRTYDVPGGAQANVTVQTAQGTQSGITAVGIDYADHSNLLGLRLLLHNPAALGAALGTLVGFCVLMAFVLKGNPQAGLPLLNGGAIVGFLLGLYYATGSFKFW